MAEGVGILLFEVCRGVPRQFHSCTEKVLCVYCTLFIHVVKRVIITGFTSTFKQIL